MGASDHKSMTQKDFEKAVGMAQTDQGRSGETGRSLIKRECQYYNWGNNPHYDYPAPREYGARCEKHNAFFAQGSAQGPLNPDCSGCQEA